MSSIALNSEKKVRPRKIQSKGGLAKLGYSPREIEQRTAVIYNKVLSHSQNLDDGNFTRFSKDDLKRLFELYDRHFFNNFFTKNHGDKIFFRLSKRMTRSGGKTSYGRKSKTFEIYLSTTLLFQTFDDVTREVKVNGIVCHDRLEAVMRILEHEMIHLMELVLFERSSCSKPQFRLFSRNIFNHSDVTHQLITQTERARETFNLRIGDRVSFEHNGQTYVGVLSRITKRATVIVGDSDGQFVDSKGKQHSKYYVPLALLTPAKDQAALEIPTEILRSKHKS